MEVKMRWNSLSTIESTEYKCGYCDRIVASNLGFFSDYNCKIYVCPHCTEPTYFSLQKQIPGISPGNNVMSVPNDIDELYNEARRCASSNCYTASVLICRKLLMNIAVSNGEEIGKRFIEYVDYLADKGYVPPNGKTWVDHIRKKGNEATHEIVVMTKDDAEELISFSEMLLKFIYEFPARVPTNAA